MKIIVVPMRKMIRGAIEWLKQHRKDLTALFFAVIFYEILGALLKISCPIKFLTGISCAGCGMTRAWLAVLRLDFAAAFGYHPLFPLVPLAIGLYLMRRHVRRPVLRGCEVLIIAAFLVVYALRMADGTDTIVVFEPENGMIVKTLRWLLKHINII